MKYTIDDPKKVKFWTEAEEENFTGVVKDEDGNVAYYNEGKFHRIGGPALIYASGNLFYIQNNKFHREDGPAAIFTTGKTEYWLHHKKLDISTDSELKDYLTLRMFE